METQEPARKRPKTEADGSENLADVSETKDVPLLSRDETYYLEDGDCVIRVQDVLFKVHRYLLARNSSTFADMFSMPQKNCEGEQLVMHENFVVLQDNVDWFRALCWSIYALPTDYMDQADESKVDIGKLVSLYLIAHKYQFESNEIFARNLLKIHCSNIRDKSARIQEYFVTCLEKRLKNLMRVALLTTEAPSDSSLACILQQVWLFRFERKTQDSISYALNVGELLGLRDFMGKLYYHDLITTATSRIEGSVVYYPPADHLDPHQKLAFLQGHWSLRLYWSDFLNAPPKKFKCQAGHACNRIWKVFWPSFKEENAGRYFDPLQHLKSCLKNVTTMNQDVFLGANIHCIVSYINETMKELEASLADHFLGPLSSAPLTVEV